MDGSSFPDAGNYALTDRTLTHYDFADTTLGNELVQENLRNRVSYVEAITNDTLKTHYSYDIHGSVKSLLQQLPGLRPKRTDYVYDLISGNVNYVMYQYGEHDQFIHQYAYDADNRITDVYTSSDGFIWNNDANYRYYLHGPVARVELGEYRVQGLDYFYTIHGWIKGVNSPYAGDPGKDGLDGNMTGKDVFAYSLGYFTGDYKSINNQAMPEDRDQLWTRLQENMNHTGLYNGNISWMATDLAKIGEKNNDRTKGMQAMLYKYDQLQRITQSRSLTQYNPTTGFAARAATPAAYDEDYTYDANGNILTLKRMNELGAMKDDFDYQYYSQTNKLRGVVPITRDTVYEGAIYNSNKLYKNIIVQNSAYIADGEDVVLRATDNIDIHPQFNKANGNSFRAYIPEDGPFVYDAIGNQIADQQEGTKICWTPYGKVREVKTKGDSVTVSFRYDGAGNRVEKRVIKPDTTYVTRYVLDASGNVMGIYNDTIPIELPIYGSSRLGQYGRGAEEGGRTLGLKKFELSNHLGNIVSVITDNVGMDVDSVWATVVFASDYYPFGLGMDGRIWSDTTLTYRYGFNGKEKDDGNSIHFEFREYDSRLGRFKSIDPIASNYPWQSPYVFAGNNPIAFIDILGMGPGDPKTHTVAKGDNLTKISKKYGVSVKDLKEMNGLANPDKLKIGQVLHVNPEANFSDNPWKIYYKNPDNSDGVEREIDDISDVGFTFVTGLTYENTIIVGGDALKSVQGWSEVKTRVDEALGEIMKDGRGTPGEHVVIPFSAESLPTNIKKSIWEAFVSKLKGEDPWENNRMNSPINVLGSFTLSVRVNANGTTATVCVYDSKTATSGSDNRIDNKWNRSRKNVMITPALTTTYQRYLWNVNIK